MHEPVLRGRAPAKVNLGLQTVGRRRDGYHNLVSEVAFLPALSDGIGIRRASKLGCTVEGPFEALVPGGEENLVCAAVRLMDARFGTGLGYEIVLDKQIPPQSGLGGGSADAACVMRLLARGLPGFGPSLMGELMSAGLALGADVPVCLRGCASRVGGIGRTHGVRLVLPKMWVVVVWPPGEGLSTAEVYRAHRRGLDEGAGEGNALWPAAVRVRPRLRKIREHIEHITGEAAQLTGSGSALVLRFAGLGRARWAVRRLRAAGFWAACSDWV